MPTINPDIALILAADKLSDAIAGIIPKASIIEDAIHQLMVIFRTQALAASNATSAQRVLREIADTHPAPADQGANTCVNSKGGGTQSLDGSFQDPHHVPTSNHKTF